MRVRDELLSLGLLTHLLAFVALPALHLVGHAPDHEHGPGGVIVARHQPADGSPHRDAPDPHAPAHGDGSAAHLAAAYSGAAAFVFVPCLARLGEAPLAPLVSVLDGGVGYGCAAPRGPPTLG
jgi:hypothetical protein